MQYILDQRPQPALLGEQGASAREAIELVRHSTHSTELTGYKAIRFCLDTFRGSGIPAAQVIRFDNGCIVSRQEPPQRIPWPPGTCFRGQNHARSSRGCRWWAAAEVPTQFCRLGQPW